MMTKNEQQYQFVKDVAKFLPFLVDYCDKNGLLAVFGETQRTSLQAWVNSMPEHSILSVRTPDAQTYTYTNSVGGVGILKSKHLDALAMDFLFFKDGALIERADILKPLIQTVGDFWESLSPENRWGGNFKTAKPDPDHIERNV